MKITKDQATIFANLLCNYKYDIVKNSPLSEKWNESILSSLVALENELDNFCKDNRRNGRTSQNTYWDCLKRFSFNHQLQNDKTLLFAPPAASKKYRLHHLAKKAVFKIDAHKRTVFLGDKTELVPAVFL